MLLLIGIILLTGMLLLKGMILLKSMILLRGLIVFFPTQTKLILAELMTQQELDWLNTYHQTCRYTALFKCKCKWSPLHSGTEWVPC